MVSRTHLFPLPGQSHSLMSWFQVVSTSSRYQITRRPSGPVVYTFWTQTTPPNSMILAPPPDQEDSHPSYYISVILNCFTPSSYITTIKRGSEEGDLVGDFEMGLTTSKKVHTVCIRGNEYPISDILESSYRRPFRNAWTWKTSDHDKSVSLFWDESSTGGVMTCFSSKDKTSSNVLAKFIPPVHLRKHGRPAEMNRLEVSPQGHDLFEDILMSALILERVRTTPFSLRAPGP